MTPVVTLRRYQHNGNPGTEAFIDYAGRRFYTRQWILVDDTPHARVAIAQEFLRRLERFPSGVVAEANYQATQDNVAKAMSMDDLPLTGSRANELLAFAKEGSPPATRPALRIVKD